MDLVFHAGALSAQWARGGAAEFRAVNVGGTENVLEGCRRHGIRRLIYVSSPSVFSNGKDQEGLTEESPLPRRFVSVYSQTKKLGEDRVAQAALTGLETIVLRPKAVFGPGDLTLLPRLLTAARAGRLRQIGDGTNRLDLTYIDNAVHALRLCIDAPASALGRTYNVTNGESAALWEVIRRMLRGSGVSDDLRCISFPAALLAAGAMEALSTLTGREPALTRYSIYILARTQTFDISAARRDLGYEPIVPFSEGLERTMVALSGHHSSAINLSHTHVTI